MASVEAELFEDPQRALGQPGLFTRPDLINLLRQAREEAEPDAGIDELKLVAEPILEDMFARQPDAYRALITKLMERYKKLTVARESRASRRRLPTATAAAAPAAATPSPSSEESPGEYFGASRLPSSERGMARGGFDMGRRPASASGGNGRGMASAAGGGGVPGGGGMASGRGMSSGNAWRLAARPAGPAALPRSEASRALASSAAALRQFASRSDSAPEEPSVHAVQVFATKLNDAKAQPIPLAQELAQANKGVANVTFMDPTWYSEPGQTIRFYRDDQFPLMYRSAPIRSPVKPGETVMLSFIVPE